MSDHRDHEDERERLSWREIDRLRDRPRSRLPRSERRPPRQAEWIKKMVLRQAEALFKGKRGNPAYQAALKALEEAHGTKKFDSVARKFLAEYGLPDTWGTLNLLLDFPEPQVVLEAMEAMRQLYPERSRVEQQGFGARLRVLALTSKHGEVRRRAEELLEELK